MVNEIVRIGLSRGGNNHPVLQKKADYKCLHSKPVLPNNPLRRLTMRIINSKP